VHPSQANGIEWNDGNERELVRHGISLADVLQIFANHPVWTRNKNNRAGQYKMVGQTNGGRRLTIVILMAGDSDRARPITGWDSTRGELRRYGR
jgi:uncharacterized DUF497 family protein